MKCVECGAEVASEAKFCSECGAKIIRKIFCSECGTELKPDQKFCSECGTPNPSLAAPQNKPKSKAKKKVTTEDFDKGLVYVGFNAEDTESGQAAVMYCPVKYHDGWFYRYEDADPVLYEDLGDASVWDDFDPENNVTYPSFAFSPLDWADSPQEVSKDILKGVASTLNQELDEGENDDVNLADNILRLCLWLNGEVVYKDEMEFVRESSDDNDDDDDDDDVFASLFND